jgi:hypothetical protein
MKAIVQDRYGDLDVLDFRDIDQRVRRAHLWIRRPPRVFGM